MKYSKHIMLIIHKNINYPKLAEQGRHQIQRLTQEAQEIFNAVEGIFNILNNKYCPQHNETIKYLQYCRSSKQDDEMQRNGLEGSGKQWQSIIRKKWSVKEQLIPGLNENEMLTGIICEFTDTNITGVVTSMYVVAWARQVESQRLQTAIMDSLRETMDFDAIRSEWVKQETKPVAKAPEQRRILVVVICINSV